MIVILTGGGLVAGDGRANNKGERERERKHAQISEREKLQSKFLLKFSYRKILSKGENLLNDIQSSILISVLRLQLALK